MTSAAYRAPGGAPSAAVARVRATRTALVAAHVARAALFGGAVTVVLGVAAGWWSAGAALGVVVAGIVAAAGVRRATVPRVALWIEERVPRLEYALVTAVELFGSGRSVDALEARVRQVTWRDEVRRALGRALVLPAVVLLAAMGVAFGARYLLANTRAGSAAARIITGGREAAPATSPLARVRAHVVPPAYTGARDLTVDEPAVVDAIVGSRVELSGRGGTTPVSAALDDRPMRVDTAGGQWRVAFSMDARSGVLRLLAGSVQRLVAIEARSDSAPVVVLSAPPRDSVLRSAAATFPLHAELHDDWGLATASFEYIVSSGEGESFTFRSGSIGARRLANARGATLDGTLSLAALELKPGDVVHVRAIARDGNTVSGPGEGASETRVIRIARQGEYDSVAVEGAPPPEADKSALSQRMLIMLTEKLEARRPRLDRPALLGEARTIARDQNRLRKAVGDIVFSRLEGDSGSGEHSHDEAAEARTDSSRLSKAEELLRAADSATGGAAEILDFEGGESPVVAINRPLLEAYNHMWDAGRHLEQGETREALPPMYAALAAIQRARQAERIYLRGKPPKVVVDLARVRMSGKDKGTGSTRTPRPPLDPRRAARVARFLNAAAMLDSAPAAAIDTLLVLRVDALDADPPAARALGAALAELRAGRDATGALVRARRALEGDAPRGAAVSPWSRGW
jgi:hypothetical protein